MSKDIFQEFREEEIHTMVSMPYHIYKDLLETLEFEYNEFKLVKHFNPFIREQAKKDSKWKDLESTRRECREEQKDIEFEIRRSIKKSK